LLVLGDRLSAEVRERSEGSPRLRAFATKKSAACKPLHYARVDAMEKRSELSSRRRGGRLEAERLVSILDVHAVEAEKMEVYVQVEARARAVHAGHRAGLGAP
jgi:hypothetical protein